MHFHILMETYVAMCTLVHLHEVTSGASFNFGVVELFWLRRESRERSMLDASGRSGWAWRTLESADVTTR